MPRTHHLLAGLFLLAFVATTAGLATAGTIEAGTNLFRTSGLDLVISIDGEDVTVTLEGNGQRPGNSDTIVERKDSTKDGDTEVIEVEIIELELKSTSSVEVNGSFFDVFVELDVDEMSEGTWVVDPGDGTFDSFFDVFFEIEIEDEDGNRTTQDKQVTSEIYDLPWSVQAPSLYPTDPNYDPNGFYPGGGPLPGQTAPVVPLPAAAPLGLALLAGLAFARRARRRMR